MNISVSQQNFKIIEKEINELIEKLNAANTLNTIVISVMAAASDQFKADLKVVLDQMLSSGQELPGDFRERALDLLSHVFESSPIPPTRAGPSLRLIHRSQNESNDHH